MKKLLLLLLSLFLLVGCSGGGNGESGGGTTPEVKNVVTVQAPTPIISMDTAIATDGTSFIAQSMCMSGMMSLDANGVPVEDLKIVSCHLGQGASLCAVKGGKSVETSMGFTPVAGIPMGTRCGDLDPAIVTFLIKNEGITADEMDRILNKESGKKGISGISDDDRDIEAAIAEGNERAKLTLDIFHYKVAQYIASYMVSLGGCDAITFAGGVGERGIYSRSEICKYLKAFGVELDEEANKIKAEERKISTDNSKIEVWIVPTNEELFIAKDTEKIVNG